MAKLKKVEIERINYELTINTLPKHFIRDWKLVEFDNGVGVPPMQYIVVQHKVVGNFPLQTSLYSVQKNVWNNQICGLIKR